MSARSTQEAVLPEIAERQKILAQAGLVLAEARSLVESLDEAGGRLVALNRSPADPHYSILIRTSPSPTMGHPKGKIKVGGLRGIRLV